MNPDIQRQLSEYLEYRPFVRSPALPSYVDYQIINELTIHGPDIYAVQRSPALVSAACIVVSCSTARLRRFVIIKKINLILGTSFISNSYNLQATI